MDGKAIAEAIAEFIVMDMQNPEIVEGKGILIKKYSYLINFILIT